jgi:chaperonin GroEL
LDVATVSANNDKKLGYLIADTYKAVGKTGIVTVDKSMTYDTYAEVTNGIKVNRGYSSPYFVNDQKRDECVLDGEHGVRVLVCDVEMENLVSIQENIFKPIIQQGLKLLIISPAGNNFVNTLAANSMKGILKVCVIPPPSSGYRQSELMQDIAVALGATYFSGATGSDMTLATFADLGHAKKVVVGKNKTTIIRSTLKSSQEDIDKRVTELRAAYSEAKKKSDKDFLLERIASLTGGVGVIFVGGNTDLEVKELYDRADDAVRAVSSAVEEGVVPGAGKALYEINPFEFIPDTPTIEQHIAATILQKSITVPLKQILENAGLSIGNCYPEESLDGEGYNLKTGRYGNLIQMGVVDPLKVTRSALENAVSVAVTILSTNAIVTMARSYDTNN